MAKSPNKKPPFGKPATNGNGKSADPGKSAKGAAGGRPTRKPDQPVKPPRMGERSGGQSRRGTGGNGGRSGLDPVYGSYDLNSAQALALLEGPASYPPTGTFDPTGRGNGLTGVVAGANGNGNGSMPWLYTAQRELPGYREPHAGDYAFYRVMDGNPTLALAKSVITGPILASTWSFESDEDVPDERVDFIRDVLDPMRTPLVGECLRALSTGWRPFEKVWDIQSYDKLGDLITLHKIKPLLPDYTRIVVVKASGAFDGLVQDFSTTKQERVILPVNKCFVYTYDGEAGDFYGRSRHENARTVYARHETASQMAGQLGTKVSSIIPIVKFPPGESRTNDEDEATEATEFNRRIAQALVDNLTIAKGVAFETELVDAADLRANPKLAELTRWAVETVDIGSAGEALNGMVTEREYFDKLLFRAWLVPERVALEGTHGTLAESEAHADISLTDSELLHDDICRFINWYVVDEMLALNFGEEARGTVWITPSPIIDTAKQNIRKIFDAWLANPATLEIVTAETDRAAVYEQLEIPADAAGGVDANGEPTGSQGDPVADVFARARGEGPGGPNDPEAKEKEEEEKSASAIAAAMTLAANAGPLVLDNCGTGAGGFRIGNTCARGGSAAGGGDADLPERPAAYFNIDPAFLRKKYGEHVQVSHVVMSQIRPIRARPEGIANAEPLMAKAAAGQGGKRDPITLVRQSDGTYTIFDGNSTFAIAQKHGWRKIPAIVVPSDEEGARIERIAKAAKAGAHTRADDPSDIDARAAMERLPHDPQPARQTSDDLDVLYAQAREAKPAYDAMMDRGQGVSMRMGARAYDIQSKAEFAGMLADFDSGQQGPAVILAPIKGRERALEKIDGYRGDTARLSDLVRGTVAVDAVDDIPGAVAAIRAEAAARGFKVASTENRYKYPTVDGYRDLTMKVTTPAGHVTELQVNTKAMIVAKEGLGHKWYEEARTIRDNVAKENRVFTDDERGRLAKLETQMKDLYSKAWAKSQRRRAA